MQHLSYGIDSGFTKQVSAVEAREIKSNIIVNEHDLRDKIHIIRDLGYNLLNQIIEAKLINITSYKRVEDFGTHYTATITFVPSGTRMMNVMNDVFTINNENFNEKEIIEALKIAYPERFI